jgi:hypothetical protein
VKKIWSGSREVRRNRIHAESSLSRRNQWKRWKRAENQSDHIGGESRPVQTGGRHHRAPRTLIAPVFFSLVDAPNDSVPFFLRMLRHKKNRDIFVDLSHVRKITPDAIALLLAVVKFLDQRYRLYVSGNYPDEQSAIEVIRESGFNDYLKTSMPSSSRKGAIVRQDLSIDSKRADGRLARKLIDFASDGNSARRLSLKGTYGHLLECMGNTHQHAGKTPGEKTWWASAFRDMTRGCDCFTFIDMGVGIFNSVELSTRLKMYNFTGLLRPRILKELLEGKIPSSTGKSYRGRGLPSIYRSAIANNLQRFVILTNEVYADAAKNDFRNLATELPGVVLYWEVSHERR